MTLSSLLTVVFFFFSFTALLFGSFTFECISSRPAVILIFAKNQFVPLPRHENARLLRFVFFILDPKLQELVVDKGSQMLFAEKP
jgi:hypothetical protein